MDTSVVGKFLFFRVGVDINDARNLLFDSEKLTIMGNLCGYIILKG